MSITIGTQLGAHEIMALLGRGGMGEVYRARDTKLKREVAIKILPDDFSRDPDRVSRFQREAEVLASLNHPNIAAIYSLEEAHGSRYLVLELVEGETLAERLRRGPIPVEEVLSIAKSICEALEAAHEKGVVHRDLKPANVKITPDGKVKVLDFGLAKALEKNPASAMMSNSPTLINSMAATNAGIIIGTAAYMSPEQARGMAADARSDLFSLGCVLYEMLTGREAFQGDTVSDVLASVLARDPDFTLLPSKLNPRLHALLRRLLEKNPKRRWYAVGDVRIEIEAIIADPRGALVAGQIPTASRPLWKQAIPIVLGTLIAAIAVWAPWRTAPRPPQVMRVSTELGVDASLAADFGSSAVLSPDGKMIAFVARPAATGAQRIYVRRLDQLQSTALAGTEGARHAFFSPDGQWIGFFAGGKLKKISVTGGAAVTVADAPDDRGGAWTEDGWIIFTPIGTAGFSLLRVSSAGGTPQPFSTLDQASSEATHRWPQVLPGGRGVLFTASSVTGNYDAANILVQLPSGEKKVVQRGGSYGRYLPSGHLVYVHQATLFAAPFDIARLEVTGQPVPALEGVTSNGTAGGAQFSFSESGSLVYLPGESVAGLSIDWMGRDGKTDPLRALTALYGNIRFSPDGRRLVMDVLDQQFAIWTYEWARDTMSRLTFDPGADRYPVWTPDGRRITFSSSRDKTSGNLYWQRADGTGDAQRLTESKNQQFPMSWHPSGKFLAFVESRPQTSYDILVLPMEGDEASGWKPGKPYVFLESPFIEYNPAFSPDGRWLAYDSNESGISEVYVRPFPGPGGKWQISTAGGEFPTWSRNGELFYRTPDQKIWVATFSVTADSFRAEKPRLWSERTFSERGVRFRNFDLHPDGRRFAVLRAPQLQPGVKLDKVVLILNFFDELRRIAPSKR